MIVDAGLLFAMRRVEADCERLQQALDNRVQRIRAETYQRRQRINEQLAAIEDDCSWRCPSDVEVPFQG